jgi:hypothetical protein
MRFTVYDAVGAAGVSVIIVTYLLLQTGRMDSRGAAYSILNAAGSASIIVSLWFNFNLAAFIVEFFWLLISIYGIARSRFRKRATNNTNVTN